MADSYHAPEQLDVEEILRTLANLPPIPPVSHQAQQEVPQVTQYKQKQCFPQHHRQTPPKSQTQTRPSGPTADPTTITEWKHGVRHLNRLAATDPSFSASIQKLQKEQARNVSDWSSGRQRLIDEQRAKRENEVAQRAAISLPGLLDHVPLLRSEERDKEELDKYHEKVYRACRQMAESHGRELQRLGVPFFGTRAHLLRPDVDEDRTERPESEEGDVRTGNGMPRTLTKKQLLVLQQKMLSHLVDLYGD